MDKRLEELKGDWSEGAFAADTADKTLQLNAQAIGEANILKELQELDYETLIAEVEDDG